MKTYRSRRSGFTLVEILIVVIILGILAAIVIPQFTNASQDARKNSLTSQLQTLRSQIELYKLQHLDQNPTGLTGTGDVAGATAWAEMLVKTDADQAINTAGLFGPYLQTEPFNSLNASSGVFITTTDVTLGGASGTTTSGWVYNSANGKLWATAVNPAVVYNEADPSDTDNTTPAGSTP
jgi:general secretion pathway protein G